MNIVIRFFVVLVVTMITNTAFGQGKKFELSVDSWNLIEALISKESPKRDPEEIGDKHLKNKAYGLLQIRLPYLQDVNRIAGKKEIQRMWGKDELTLEDMKDLVKATWAAIVYLSHYGKVYTRKTGLTPTIEVYARIHNGGPNGWKKESTVEYGKYVAAVYTKLKNT